MRSSLVVGMLALMAGSAGNALAAPVDTAGMIRATAEGSNLLKTVGYVWGGQTYCWYDDGWQGPGWYVCDYGPWVSGLWWGGGYHWNNWHGGHSHDWYNHHGHHDHHNGDHHNGHHEHHGDHNNGHHEHHDGDHHGHHDHHNGDHHGHHEHHDGDHHGHHRTSQRRSPRASRSPQRRRSQRRWT